MVFFIKRTFLCRFLFFLLFINMEKQIIKLYLEEKLFCTEIAKRLKIHRATVSRTLKKNNIKIKYKTALIKYTHCSICEREIKDNKGNKSKCNTCTTKLRRYVIKRDAVKYKGGKCIKCGWFGEISVFDFHHREPNEKEFNLSSVGVTTRKWNDVKKELDKCDLLCANCHRQIHYNFPDDNLLKAAEKFKRKFI